MLKKLGFGRASKPEAMSVDEPLAAGSFAERERQLLSKHREMVRVAVKGTLKEHGMPATWVGCDANFATLPMRHSADADTLAIRLIVQEWHEELLRYLPALQRQVIAALTRMETAIDHTRHTVTWQFAPDCGCPVADLPPPASWSTKPAARDVASSKAVAKPKFDLPPSEMDDGHHDRDDIPSSFAATSPGFLNSQPFEAPKSRKP